MSIYVSIEVGSPQKDRGDLLEDFTVKLLEVYGYEIETEVRKTGVELDLLCKHKTNPEKKMYIECKAYNDEKKIQADVITKLSGILYIKKYREAWLIATSSIGKDAKGLIDDIKTGSDSDKFTFYTPDPLLLALQDANIIIKKDMAFQKIKSLIKSENALGESHLLISCFGNFWLTEYLKGGVVNGIIFCYAHDGEIVVDEEMISNLQKLDFRYKDNDLGAIFRLLDPNDKTMYGRRLRGACLSKNYITNFVSAIGGMINYTGGLKASIHDIFVYPDMEKIRMGDKSDGADFISSEKILSETNTGAWLIFGDDLSGKTTLSIFLQIKLSESGNIVIYLNSCSMNGVKMSNIDKLICKAFADQYDVEGIPKVTIKSYIDDMREKIILIIDDFDKIYTKELFADKFIDHLEASYYKLIILSNSSRELEFTTSNDERQAFEKFKIFKLMQLGHLKRDELIEKWIIANNLEPTERAQMLVRKDDLANRINTAIGTNYLPTYPFYTLVIIEMLESGNKAQLQGSEYAALYGHFINHALITHKVKVADLGFYNAYLSQFANKLYNDRITSISTEEARIYFSEYLKLMGLAKSYEVIHQRLVDSRVLRLDNMRYSFNLTYYRYYFFAKYLADNIETVPVKNCIKDLVDNLYEDDNANIVVFLVHHSKNSEIIDVVVNKAKTQFELVNAQTLTNVELKSVNDLITEDIKIVLQDGTAAEYRKKRLQRKDNFDRDRNNTEKEKPDNILDIFGQIMLAFRTIDVLGKITSNYYGELNAERKNLIMNELYELGFRSLRTFLDSFESYSGALRSRIESTIDIDDMPSDTEKSKVANKIIYEFTNIIIYSFVKRVSDSITSPDLMLTINSVLDEKKTPAAKVTSIATKLNFPGGLEKYKLEIIKLYEDLAGNSLSRDLLRFLVVEYLYKFEVSSRDKQSICDQLMINVAVVNRKKMKAIK